MRLARVVLDMLVMLVVLVVLVMGLAACAGRNEDADKDAELNLTKAPKPCPGPKGKVVVKVLDSPEPLVDGDGLAFRREPVGFAVFLRVVEVVEGEFDYQRLGVLVHSPTLFAGDVWGMLSSPQYHPAELELKWVADYCMFEVVGIEQPEPPPPPPDGPIELVEPTVHFSTIMD